MSMLDGNAYRRQPDLAKWYRTLVASRATTVRCDGCIATHVELARKQGASADEITDALGVAIMVDAGATLVYSAFHAGAPDATEKP